MQHDSTVEAVLEQVAEEHDGRRDALSTLAREYLRRESAGGEALDPEAEAATVRGLLQLADQRGTATASVRAFTPSQREHGYETAGSVLETNVPDQAFLVDTITEQVRAHGLQPRVVRHPVVGVVRDGHHRITCITTIGEDPAARAESLVHIELDRRLTPEEVAALEDDVRGALGAAQRVVADFPALQERLREIAGAIAAQGDGVAEGDVGPTSGSSTREEPEQDPDDDPDEVAAFLEWLAEDNAVLLGAVDHDLEDGTPIAGSELGLLVEEQARQAGREPIEPPAPGTLERLRAGDLISIGHTVALSPVHRRARMEDVAIRGVGEDGRPLLRRLVLLVASRAYAAPASETPLLRGTLHRILRDEQVLPGSHDWKAIVALFDSFPKDELFALPAADLRRTLMGFVDLGPGRVALRARVAADGRTGTVVVAVPRSSYDASVRDALRELACRSFGTDRVATHEVLREGDHAYLHLQLYDPEGLDDVRAEALEQAAARLARSWDDRLAEALIARGGEERGRVLAARWAGRLPGQYKAGLDPVAAVHDVEALEELTRGGAELLVALKHEAPDDRPAAGRVGAAGMTRVAFLVRGPKVELSRAMPILEHLGLHVVEERPTQLRSGDEIWIQDFGVLGPDGRPLDLDDCGDRVAAAITAAWRGETESDSLNRLVVVTPMGHERLEVLRAYRRYRQRIGSRFTEGYQNDVIVQHAAITEKLVRLFELRFGAPAADGSGGPDAPRDEPAEQALKVEILADLDEVPSLDHDRILRNQLQMIEATYRTNAYRPGRQALAFKLKSAEVPAIPHPTPLWEIYVHGLDVEGIHLRGGMIARGGLRWSDRMDYRTEVLGLMRAQMVKNSVIVPAGAKGGFLVRNPPRPAAAATDHARLREAVREGYVHFISALLDVTDDLRAGAVVHPTGVRVLDGDDQYLVVAADKGTATFSDTANEIAVARGFWLGDAFASGGSAGYDHKVLGITARGAWESVKRHFREIGVDPERDPITAVGIGDMSGDVFGNGMLLSRSLRLIAAYDHRHVFVDPDPRDVAASWSERKRLFELGRSSWDDYDRALISEGGGVFPRTAKSVPISDQMRSALGIEDAELPPSELIRAVLRAPVDLLWNGGIGTVVKASHERDSDAEDRASDSIRVDAADLRARVVGEGGNLGFTAAARIELAAAGGAINADFIDNSAGVDSSDHEVNLKILLDSAVRQGLLAAEERNGLLAAVTDEVVEHVLANSFAQARVLTQEQRKASDRTLAAEELMTALEEEKQLERATHGLPSADELADRRAAGRGLTRPELSVLVALAKISITRALLDSPYPDEPALVPDLEAYFPASFVERFGTTIGEHPLRRELLATLAANEIVNTMGPTFVARRAAEFTIPPSRVVRGFRVAVGATDARPLWDGLDQLEGVAPDVVWQQRAEVDDLIRATSRWHVAHADDDLAATIEAHREGTRAIREQLDALVPSDRRRRRVEDAIAAGVPRELAREIAAGRALLIAPHIVDGARAIGRSVLDVAVATLSTERLLGLEVLQQTIDDLPLPNRMVRWATQALRDDLFEARATIARSALGEHGDVAPVTAVDAFLAARPATVGRLRSYLRELSPDVRGSAAGSAVAAPVLAIRQLQAIGEAAAEPERAA
ncbi:NAD-glutamate dehydrogenase domain-containing protein [Patulibacter medicamentivorans]|uniref:NAD-glutamate dehydrogenase domain-containing protein n=1 Tax=Patulibacter medicamentivorans TaxID=1097667 RepID=UPI0014795968|nr:NAD-glutamate dehydrogenase domain-containing protein [Patulibacter medicamentivorans]